MQPIRARRRAPRSPLGQGLRETTAVLAGFMAFGLGLAHGLEQLLPGAPARPADPYAPGRSHPMSDDAPLWLIDGYNAVCAGLLGGRDRERWWSAERRAELLDRLERFDDPAAEFEVVFDGAMPADGTDGAPGRVRAVFAPSADSWLVRRAEECAQQRPVAVVTGDARVAERARRRGAHILSPRELLRRCAVDPPGARARS